jgi:hypothetical protein
MKVYQALGISEHQLVDGMGELLGIAPHRIPRECPLEIPVIDWAATLLGPKGRGIAHGKSNDRSREIACLDPFEDAKDRNRAPDLVTVVAGREPEPGTGLGSVDDQDRKVRRLAIGASDCFHKTPSPFARSGGGGSELHP